MASFVSSADFNNGQTFTAGAGSNRVIIFGVPFMDGNAATTVTGITFGGVAAHRIGGVVADTGSGNRQFVDVWYMNEADGIPTGSQTCTVTFSEAISTTRVHALTIQNAHQTDFSVTNSNTNLSATSISTSLTSLDTSVALAFLSSAYNAGNTGITNNWSGSTENTDGTSGSPTQRYWSARKDVTTGASESIDASWSVAVPVALFAVLVKDVSAGGTENPLAHIKRYGPGRYIPFGR